MLHTIPVFQWALNLWNKAAVQIQQLYFIAQAINKTRCDQYG